MKKATGKKDCIGDPNKPRISLFPKKALWSASKALTVGEHHYGAHNWKGGIPISILMDSALRHITQFLDGEDIDVPSQNLHLGNAVANLAIAIDLLETYPEMDDRYKKTKKGKKREGKKTVRRRKATNKKRSKRSRV